jgi:UDP-N-acetylmuramate dehydrogenase
MPYFILGTGANILVGDLGFRGLVIKNEANNFSFSDNVLVSESGATIESLIKESLDRALSGLEHFVGIPSSVGGALWQNLHFLSPERTETLYIGNILESAEVLDEENNLLKVDRDFFNFGYDESILHGGKYLVTEASFRLTSKDKKEIQKQMDENMRWREEKQPQLREFPSCGSVFKKIDGVGAGRLIDKCGLKGYSSGGVQISEKHANYLINTGDATAKDVRDVIEHIQRVVKEQAGYVLEPEISFVGEFV